MKQKRFGIRIAAAAVAIILLLSALAGCGTRDKASDGGTVLMRLGDCSVSVNLYQLLLSRMRAVLEANGADVDSDSYWKTVIHADGENLTYEEYYNRAILENCKTYLAALYLFDEKGLKLSDAAVTGIDEDIDLLIDTDAGGSASEFNRILGEFGANTDILRAMYLTEARIKQLRASLYGASGELISDSVKEAYVAEHFVHFKQVLLANYEYAYETDDRGDRIYYYTDGDKKDHVYYDTVLGIPSAAGEKDTNGDLIYYTEDGKIAYNTEKGTPAFRTDQNGNPVINKYSDETVKKLKADAAEYAAGITAGDYTAFEALMSERSDDREWNPYTDGYYINTGDTFTGSSAYIGTIVKTLGTLKPGECAVVEADDGFHIVMRYEIGEGAYSKTVNEDFFGSLVSDIMEMLFLAECGKLFDRITFADGALDSAKSIRELPSNRYY